MQLDSRGRRSGTDEHGHKCYSGNRGLQKQEGSNVKACPSQAFASARQAPEPAPRQMPQGEHLLSDALLPVRLTPASKDTVDILQSAIAPMTSLKNGRLLK